MMIHRSATFCLAAAVCLAQNPEPASVEGRVLRGATGAGLPKASVTLRPAEGRSGAVSAGADETGRFEFTGVAPGRYRLIASRNGYRTTEYGQRGNSRSGTVLVLAPGQRLRDIRITLSPGAVIAGRVLNEDSEGIAYVRVQALRMGYLDGRPQLVPADAAATNDLGEYRIFGLPAGRY